MDIADPYHLSRFVRAQEPVYEGALAELRAGKKRSHWMWFIFPQIAGLGFSSTAQHYAIGDLDEARAYLAHPLLRPRLLECVAALLQLEGRAAHDILGSPDDLKLCSCATLFEQAGPGEAAFAELLNKYYQGKRDEKTLRLLHDRQT